MMAIKSRTSHKLGQEYLLDNFNCHQRNYSIAMESDPTPPTLCRARCNKPQTSQAARRGGHLDLLHRLNGALHETCLVHFSVNINTFTYMNKT